MIATHRLSDPLASASPAAHRRPSTARHSERIHLSPVPHVPPIWLAIVSAPTQSFRQLIRAIRRKSQTPRFEVLTWVGQGHVASASVAPKPLVAARIRPRESPL